MRNGPGGFGHRGGRSARTGIYVRASTGEWMQHPGGPLPGSERARYVRIPALLVLVIGPLLGGIYFVSFSFVSFSVVAWSLGRRGVRGVAGLLAQAMESLVPAWAPGHSYLATFRTGRAGSEDPQKRDVSDGPPQSTRDVEESGRKEEG